MRRWVVLLVGMAFLLGCDPVQFSHTFVDLPARRLETTTSAIVVHPGAADASEAVAAVARRFGFGLQPVSEEAQKAGWSQAFKLRYQPDPQQRIFHDIKIISGARNGNRFEVVITEFVASRESDLGKRVRLAVSDELVARFGPDAVRSAPD